MDEGENSSEGAALEAAAALAAVAALVDGLQAFLSPHLAALLHLLFSPAVLACNQSNCSNTAASIRIQLAGVMPARLLLGPLFGHFDGAVQVSLQEQEVGCLHAKLNLRQLHCDPQPVWTAKALKSLARRR